MIKERNKQIACLVLKGRTYDSVGIEYNISRERVYQKSPVNKTTLPMFFRASI